MTLHSPWDQSPRDHRAIQFSYRVAVATTGRAAASVWHQLLPDGGVLKNVWDRVILHFPGGASGIEIRPVPGPDANTMRGNLAAVVTAQVIFLAGTIKKSVARWLVVTVRHDAVHDPRWQPVATSDAYQGHITLDAVFCGTAMALGNRERGVRLLARSSPSRTLPDGEYVIPQSATGMHFGDASRLVIGTTRDVICLSVDAMEAGVAKLTGIAWPWQKGWGLPMADPFSAAALVGVVLTEGIKFLYRQAGEVLKRWRERRETGGTSVEDARLHPPEGLLEGTVEPVEPQDDQADGLEEELRQARRLLADYAEGIEVPRPGDHLVAEQADALRRLLEAVYGQRITFRGSSVHRRGRW